MAQDRYFGNQFVWKIYLYSFQGTLEKQQLLCVPVQGAYKSEGLSVLWNELVKDGEVLSNNHDGLVNGAGVTAKKGTKPLHIYLLCCSLH